VTETVLLLATEDLEVRAVVRPPTGPPFDQPQEHILAFLQYFTSPFCSAIEDILVFFTIFSTSSHFAQPQRIF
jgi:hypothetical protein